MYCRLLFNVDFIFIQPCIDIFDSEMRCAAPSLTGKNATVVVAIGLRMDDVRDLQLLENVNITVFLDPVFNANNDFTVQPGQTRNLTLTVNYYFT